MFRKKYYTFLLAISLFTALSATALAQMGSPVRGRVEMMKDGAKVPVAEATVDAYRNEGKGKISAKTNKKGEFQYAGLMLGQTYTLAISGPGLRPQVYPKVKSGMQDIVVEVTEGDGKVLTEEEAKTLAKQALPAEGDQMSEEEKKRIADLEKQNAEVLAKNERIKQGDDLVRKSYDEGKKLFEAKDFSGALAKFNEGISAVPDFVGSTPILMTHKIMSLKERGIKTFNESIKMSDAAQKTASREAAKKDFTEGIATFDQAMAIIKAAAADPASQKQRDSMRYDLLTHTLETHKLMVSTRVDVSRAKEAIPLFEEYSALEPDAVKKAKQHMILADLLREAAEYDVAAVQYKKILETNPNNLDALAYAGLSLYMFAAGGDDKVMLQESYDLLTRFISSAPDTHNLKKSSMEFLEEIKKDESIKQKPAGKPGKKT